MTRYRGLTADDQDLTVVFDAGQNSAASFAPLPDVGLHFVGSLPPSDYPDLLAVPARKRSTLDVQRYGGSPPTRPAPTPWARRRVVLTHSLNLQANKARRFDQTIAKATRSLNELADVLRRGQRRRTAASEQAAIDRITRPGGWAGY